MAIGAQNAYVLKQGLTRNHVGLVVGICAASDALLIAIGVSGVGALVQDHPTAMTALRWVGAAYLAGYGIRALLNARHPQALDPLEGRSSGRRTVVTITITLALTYLNPHVYLDTVLMLGSVANQHDDGRWVFAAGAAAGSILWFATLGFGARAASRAMSRPVTWRILDLAIGGVMIALAVRLLLG